MLKKLVKIANKLDQKGLYEEASQLDKIIKVFADDELNTPVEKEDDLESLLEKGRSLLEQEPVEEWEAAMMEMDESPESREKEEEYQRREVSTPEEELENAAYRAEMEFGDDYSADDPLDFSNFNPGQEALKRLKQRRPSSLTPPLTPEKDRKYFEQLRQKGQ